MGEKEKPVTGRDGFMCFACSKDNPIGLHLDFTEDGDTYRTEFVPGQYHEGYPGLMHGGITSTLLDEVMGRYLYVKGLVAPTAELTVRYKAPVPIGKPVAVTGKIVEQKGRLIKMSSQLVLTDGTVAVEADAKFVKARQSAPFHD